MVKPNYAFGFKMPNMEWPRKLRRRYDIFHAWLRPRHGGLDLYSSPGSGIGASADGVVRFAGKGSKDAGWLVEILHWSPMGWYLTRYMHMQSRPLVVTGQQVVQGQLLGRVGKTGNANAEHNHFEIRFTDNMQADQWTMYGSGWGKRYDPAKFGVMVKEPLPVVYVKIGPLLKPVLHRVSNEPATLDVEDLQVLLVNRGHLKFKDVDGQFGPQTERAVKNYQASIAVEADGIVGTDTWFALLG